MSVAGNSSGRQVVQGLFFFPKKLLCIFVFQLDFSAGIHSSFSLCHPLHFLSLPEQCPGDFGAVLAGWACW